MIYLDSSALVKLVGFESESSALERHLSGSGRWASCALAHVEVIRAARKRDAESVARARLLLERIDLIAVDEPVLTTAADLADERLGSLDAVHVAAALSLDDDLAELITYDRRMVSAAEGLGLPVISPG
ncbi:type II toxin-antitoxin system VapC family toxin [soil metagenome]|nr:type II toxin-antitoxin system VapC family toxin [Thermoleophilaceae bacterium]MDQ3433327.1 type II toxin-antitoxin system VapC family toxin [Actinomycetota bacterium]